MNDLEMRCLKFAKAVRTFCKKVKYNGIDNVYLVQVARSSSSVGANYIEANEKLGPKDLLYRIRIARKEAKETMYWLDILSEDFETLHLKQEALELRRILSAIINKIENNQKKQIATP